MSWRDKGWRGKESRESRERLMESYYDEANWLSALILWEFINLSFVVGSQNNIILFSLPSFSLSLYIIISIFIGLDSDFIINTQKIIIIISDELLLDLSAELLFYILQRGRQREIQIVPCLRYRQFIVKHIFIRNTYSIFH